MSGTHSDVHISLEAEHHTSSAALAYMVGHPFLATTAVVRSQ